jgi:hypothetical protein
MTSPPPPPEETPGDRRRDWPWLVALAAAGAVLAAMPHLIRAARTGDPAYIPDGDGLLYVAWSRDIVRHGALTMTDAVRRPSGPMMHPWLLFLPPALLTHALGLGMMGLGIVWRLLAGPAVALGLYAVVRPFAKSARGAAGLAAFLLFDAGLLVGQLLQRDAEFLLALKRGTGSLLADVPSLLPHLRVPTPALALPFFLGHLALAHRARRLGTVGPALAAGASLGLLFHVYFYFATAAALGTALAWLLDRGGRRTYALMLGLGAVIAAPAVVEAARIRANTTPDWLVRTDKFTPVRRLDRSHLILPKLLIVEWLATAWFVFRSRRDLIYLWACTGAGLALANQHVATGRNIENFHWMYAWVSFSLLIAMLVSSWLARLRGWRWVAPLIVLAQVAMGLGLRAVEVVESKESNYYLDMLSSWRHDSASWRRDGISIPPRSIVAGPPDLLLLLGAVEEIDPLAGRLVDYSSLTGDEELDKRAALNLVLIGASTERAEEVIAVMQHLTPEQRDRQRRFFHDDLAAPVGAVEKFRVEYVVTFAGGRPPGTLGDRARRIGEGSTWDLWRIEPPGGSHAQ